MADSSSRKSVDAGLLILRVGIGATFIVHGWSKVVGGPDMWAKLGGAVAPFGITFAPVFWGFMAMVAEFVGGICLVLGFLTRSFAALMLITMVVATVTMMNSDKGFAGWAYPASMAVVFLSLIFMGAGRFNIVDFIKTKK